MDWKWRALVQQVQKAFRFTHRKWMNLGTDDEEKTHGGNDDGNWRLKVNSEGAIEFTPKSRV